MKPVKSKNLVVISPKGKFILRDFKAIVQRGVIFLYPLIALYLVPIIAIIAEGVANNTFMFSLSLFMPSQVGIGGMILYVLNRLWDGINRFMKENTYKV